MNKELIIEMETILKNLKLTLKYSNEIEFIKEFQAKVNWVYISEYQKLSEEFIKEFKDNVNWFYIISHQKLSESFIKEFQNKIEWNYISECQKLSEEFIKEFQDKINWNYISRSQKLSEEFIKEFQNKVNWYWVSKYQKLSEGFIKKFQNNVNWNQISVHQKLSEEFIKKFQDKVDIKIQLESHQDLRTKDEKLQIMKNYAEQHNLKFENETLYCFRNHDVWNRGSFTRTIHYESKGYYSDWHCDLNIENENSFGLGAWSKGNIPISIHVDDFGCVVEDNRKIRCFGFTII